MRKNPILVTGAHRSGTTWTGKIISSTPELNYIHEPFNIGMDRPESPISIWFEHITDNSDPQHQRQVANYINSFSKSTFKGIAKNFLKIKSLTDFGTFLKGTVGISRPRTLLKDPIALMSCEWMASKMNCDVVIIIRHPAAFIASLKVKDWHFDFNNYLNQNDLMTRHLSEFKQDIEQVVDQEISIVDQGIILWNTLYSTVQQYKEKYSDNWYFVQHEELSRNPMVEFEKMFKFLDVKFSPSVQKEIRKTTTSSKATKGKRNSAENIKTWKQRLNQDEIDKIKKGTASVWKHFYTEDDWL